MLTLFVRHGLTKPALCDVLSIIKLMLPSGSSIFTSFFKLLAKFELRSTKTRRIFFCDKCHQKVETESGPLPCKCKQSNRAFMVILDLSDELHHRLQGAFACSICWKKKSRSMSAFSTGPTVLTVADPDYQELLRQQRATPRTHGTFADVCDGAAYRCGVAEQDLLTC